MSPLYNHLYGPQSLNAKLFLALNHLHHPLLDPLMTLLITVGSSRSVYLYAGILFVVSLACREKVPLRYPVIYVLATLLALVLEEGLKEYFAMPRPAAALGLDKVRVLGGLKLKNSFPSGHAGFACVTAYTLAYGRSWRWKVPLIAFAVLVMWSRMYVGAHYPLDVLGGAAVGLFSGWSVWQLYEWWEARPMWRGKNLSAKKGKKKKKRR